MTDPSDTWKHVAGPDEPPQPTTGGRRAQARRPARVQVEDKTPRRRAMLILTVVTVALVAIAAGGGYLVNRLSPASVITQTVTPTAAPGSWPLALPVSIGDYSRDANQGATPTRGADGKQTVSAQYSRQGEPAALILLSRPHTDGKLFMQEANMNAVTEASTGWCGISGDNDLDGCLVIRDQTAVLVMAIQDISRDDLIALTTQVADQVDG